MFDIGFWEIIFIAVITLVVVGPDEFPVMIRNIGRSVGKVKQFFSSVKSDLDYEIDRANEIKELMEQESKIAEMQEFLSSDARRATKPVNNAPHTSKIPKSSQSDEAEEVEPSQGSAQSVGDKRPDKRPS